MNITLNNKEVITKVYINSVASDLLEKLNMGEINPLLLLEKFKGIEKIHDYIKTALIEAAIIEMRKYPEKELNLFGGTFKIQEFGTKYSYDNCNDPVYNRLFEECEKAKKALKEREDFLKSIKGSETVVDTKTAEIVTVFPPVKTSSTGVSCSIK